MFAEVQKSPLPTTTPPQNGKWQEENKLLVFFGQQLYSYFPSPKWVGIQ
jgi:hypothetical protein